jgi:hypothetical protein
MNGFGNRELTFTNIQRRQRRLDVRRDGVMDHRPDAFGLETHLEGVTIRRANDE